MTGTGIRRPPNPDWFDRLRRCEGKEKLNRSQADKRSAQIRKRDRNAQCQAYECKYCGAWHIGHTREPIK